MNLTKRIICLATLLSLPLGTTVVSADMTHMERKVMQTRIFTSPPSEVATAVENMCKDLDAAHVIGGQIIAYPGNNRGVVTCVMNISMPEVGFLGVLKVKEGQIAQIEASLSWEDDKESTLVRLRVSRYGDDKSTWMTKTQSENPVYYQTYFRSIADYMFMDAIEWSPSAQE